MRTPALLAILLLAGHPAAAALSGFYDSAEKIAAILGSGAVADQLRQAPIRSVENTGTTPDGHDEWTVRTQECDLKLRLIAEPPPEGTVGMTTYTAEPIGVCE